ncbi:hypothetical protein FC84_GL001612 [Lapidilactobacillus dextrinicus DSM 20335]|uniref:Uncharacterized protein n=1 Tax=Lapidilactobacillus dextrinicus DSM 20335 TaxID=1423738 RepID=A0A0R2BUJ9_9LACO|nr:DUF1642 domain-containing protein [Lapidilactobacillus dextrinicus]KRM79436.1 hypothetical protein FC84_GL001612 [Lapidilactobacillus dextrinicus DSM 20335]QFG46734.1 DUF1642 domain-containing protein [Lapidilactobacillus dextrinicus]
MKYRKTALIEAEQYIGSPAQVIEYNIVEIPPIIGTDKPYEYFIPTLEGPMELHAGDWIATGVNGEHWPIADDVFKKTYAKLPVIPYNVAAFIKLCKGSNIDLRDVLYFENNGFDYVKEDEARIGDWIADHQDKVARAWLDGYEVEK